MTKAQIKLEPELKIIREAEIPHLLVPGEVGAILELTVLKRDGQIRDHRVMKSESFVRQFLELLWIQAFQLPYKKPYSIRDTSNTLRDIANSGCTFDATGAVGEVVLGIIAGTGNTAVTINDYAIETLIAHGVGAGQLQYGAVTFGAPASDATTSQFTITRNFANGSGGAITVNEVGLYVDGYLQPNHYPFMIIRDIIGGGISVPDGETLTVNYREQAVV